MPVGRKEGKPLLRMLTGGPTSPTEAPPIWLMRQAGRYLPEYRALRAQAPSFLDFCFTPDLAVEATLQPIRRFGFDARHHVHRHPGDPPCPGPGGALRRRPRALAGAGAQQGGYRRDCRPRACAIAWRRSSRPCGGSRQNLPAETTLIGFAGAPWTVASYMIEGAGGSDFVKAKRMAYGEPELFAGLIDLLVESTVDYLVGQIEAGAEVLQLFDSWSGAPGGARAAALVAGARWPGSPQRLKALHPEIPVIVFPRGAGLLYRDFAIATGAAAPEPGQQPAPRLGRGRAAAASGGAGQSRSDPAADRRQRRWTGR